MRHYQRGLPRSQHNIIYMHNKILYYVVRSTADREKGERHTLRDLQRDLRRSDINRHSKRRRDQRAQDHHNHGLRTYVAKKKRQRRGGGKGVSDAGEGEREGKGETPAAHLQARLLQQIPNACPPNEPCHKGN